MAGASSFKEAVVTRRFWMTSIDGLGDGWESTIWDTHATLIARVDAPDLRVQRQAFNTLLYILWVVFDDLTIPYSIWKSNLNHPKQVCFPARTPVSVTSKLEVFSLPPQKNPNPNLLSIWVSVERLLQLQPSTIPRTRRRWPATTVGGWDMECSDWCQEALEQTGADLGYTQGVTWFLLTKSLLTFKAQNFNHGRLWKHQGYISQPRSLERVTFFHVRRCCYDFEVGQKDSGSAIFFSDFTGFHVSGV